MHAAPRMIAVLALLITGCASDDRAPRAGDTPTSDPTTPAPVTEDPVTGDPVDWNDRSGVDITLASGWRIVACDGDAPFLCASGPDGTVGGSILLAEYPAAGGPLSRSDAEAEADDLYRVAEEDRQLTCGPDFALDRDPVTPITVGGHSGYRYGYHLRDGSGHATERVVLHVVVDGSRLIVINTAFSDPEGCPGEDPERVEFPIDTIPAIDPYLDQIVAESILPTA